METKVNKTMLIVASAVLAATTTWVPAAQAKGGGGGGHHSGGGMKFSSAPSTHHHHRVFRRDSYVASGYKAEEAREKRAKLVALPAPAGPGAKPIDCKKYFPSVGETLPVPCEG